MNLDSMIQQLLGDREDVYVPKTAIAGRTFLVTGAGGTIGSQLCRTLIECNAARVVMLEKDELALYNVHQELPDRTVPALGDYGDIGTVTRLVETYRPEMVIHAGAYKHVPLVERNPIAGVVNNVLKFQNLLTALNTGRDRMTLIVVSSDKAVRPTTVMGVTKYLVELLAINCRHVRPHVVRFGNVLGSSGSVLPLWMSQWEREEAITVTDEEVTRYFMSVQEAVALILNARTVDGISVLDMGAPVKIMEMAQRFLTLMGDPAPGEKVGIKIVGLRPGEKLHEELNYSLYLTETLVDRVMKDASHAQLPQYFQARMQMLADACEAGDTEAVRSLLMFLAPEYKPSCEIQDDCFRTPSPETY